jgi:autotransporter-associated beta strand protein
MTLTNSSTGATTVFQASDVSNVAHNIALSGQLGGAGGLTKTGNGTLTLSGVNSYGGATVVNAGTLLANAYGAMQSTTAASATGNTITYGTLPSGIAVGQTMSGEFGGGGAPGSTTITAISGTTVTTADPYTGNLYDNSLAFDLSAWQSLGGGNVTVGNGSGTPVLDIGASTQAVSAVTLNNGTIQGVGGTLQGSSYAVNSGTVSTVLADSFASSSALTKATTGTVTLSGANTYTGATTVSNGTLALSGAGKLGTGDLNANGGIIDLGGTTASSVGVTTMAGGAINNGTLTGTSYAAQSGSASAVLAGSGVALNKTTTGTVTLTGANTYTGATTVQNGTLLINGSGSLAAASAVTVGNTTTASLTPTLGGTGTVNGVVTILGPGSGSAGHLAPGSAGAGTLTVGSLTLNAGSQLDWNITSPGTLTQVSVTTAGGLTISGGQLNINGGLAAFTTAGTYNLIGYSGALTGAATNLTLNPLNNAGAGYTYTFGTSGSFITLTVGAPAGPTSSAWASTTGGGYGTSGNWSSGVPDGAGATATFGSALTTSGTVSLASNRTLGHVGFNNSAASYTVGANGGNTLTINNVATGATGSPDITVNAGSHTIAAPVLLAAGGVNVNTATSTSLAMSGGISDSGAGATLTKSGNGTLTLSGSQSYSVLTTNAGGTANPAYDAVNNPGVAQKLGTTNVNAVLASTTTVNANGGTTNLNPGNGTVQTLSALNVGSGAVAALTAGSGGVANVKTLNVSALSIAGGATPTGTVDIGNGAMVVHGGNIATIQAQAISGFNNFSNNGTGINSSYAAAGTDGLPTTVGVLDNSVWNYNSFGGVNNLNTDPNGAYNQVLVKYTYYGDANLDGVVDATDYSLIDAGFFNGVPVGNNWLYGDFNGDGVVDATDYSLIDAGYFNQAGTLAVSNSIQAVPEPSTFAMLIMGAVGVIGIVRFKNKKIHKSA